MCNNNSNNNGMQLALKYVNSIFFNFYLSFPAITAIPVEIPGKLMWYQLSRVWRQKEKPSEFNWIEISSLDA